MKPLRAENWLDRLILSISPSWGLSRLRARAASHAFQGATSGRRSAGWNRPRGDANAVLATSIVDLRANARDLLRNNSWARRAQSIVANSVVGWGIVPKAASEKEAVSKRAQDLWRAWADTTQCDALGRATFSGLQQHVIRSVFADGEVLIRRRPRLPKDGLAIPLQLQLLEAEHLDLAKDQTKGLAGGPIIHGVEFDALGRRVAYWLFPSHPGSSHAAGGEVQSQRVQASEVLHIFNPQRLHQVRGYSWLAAAIVGLKMLDEYEDAELMKQRIAACFAAFVIDPMGASAGVNPDPDDDGLESFEPGMVKSLSPGKDVKFASPPTMTADTLPIRVLRKTAAGLNIPYEDFTGDYSQTNYSSARMGRLAHQGAVRDWQWNMMVPQFCDGVWAWAMSQAVVAGDLLEVPTAQWTCPPLPMIEPDKEFLAYSRGIRNGLIPWSDAVREQGGDPSVVLAQLKADAAAFDSAGLKLDCDPRAVSQAGLTQERVGGGEAPGKPKVAADS